MDLWRRQVELKASRLLFPSSREQEIRIRYDQRRITLAAEENRLQAGRPAREAAIMEKFERKRLQIGQQIAALESEQNLLLLGLPLKQVAISDIFERRRREFQRQIAALNGRKKAIESQFQKSEIQRRRAEIEIHLSALEKELVDVTVGPLTYLLRVMALR